MFKQNKEKPCVLKDHVLKIYFKSSFGGSLYSNLGPLELDIFKGTMLKISYNPQKLRM